MFDQVVFPVFDITRPQFRWIKTEWKIDETILRKYAIDENKNVFYIDLPPLPTENSEL